MSKTPSAPAPTTSPWATRRHSKIHGGGLFARQAIPEGERIIEYVGDSVTKAEALRRDARRRERQEAGDDGCVYLFEVNQRHDIDGDVPWNTARLINHSCEPNCEPQNLRGHIWIVALRDIAKGEELSYDYGFDWDGWEEHPCRCGAPTCVGYIVKRSKHKKLRKLLAQRAKEAKRAAKKERKQAKRQRKSGKVKKSKAKS